MSISYEQFVMCAHHFEKISNTLRDGWKIYYNGEDEFKTLYLKKMNFSLSTELGRQVLWEYHILYSNAYCVPVLYFNVCFDSGKLLSLENLECFIDPLFKEQFNQNKWNILTQQEHPITRTPFFMLHPCRTEDFMKIATNSNVNPLVTWLSSISPMVNLKLDLQYGATDFTFNESNNIE